MTHDMNNDLFGIQHTGVTRMEDTKEPTEPIERTGDNKSQDSKSPTEEKKLSQVVEEAIVVDDSDLELFLKPKDVEKLKTWAAELKAAQDKPRLIGFKTPEITTTFQISVDDILNFDGTYEKGIQSPCVTSIFPEDKLGEVTKGPVIITGSVAKVSSISDEFSLLKEPILIGSSMTQEFLHNQSVIDPKRPAHQKFAELEQKRGKDQMLGVIGRSNAHIPFMFVPAPDPAYLAEHENWALLTKEAACARSATLPRKDAQESMVIMPENHGLVMILKNSTLSFIRQVSIISAADPTKKETQYIIISQKLYSTLANEAVRRGEFACPSTTLDKHYVFAIYKYKEEVWKDPEERARLEALPAEKRAEKHTLSITYSIEHYNLTPTSAPWRSRKGLEGVWAPGVPIVDLANALQKFDEVRMIPNSELNKFYTKESAKRAAFKKSNKVIARAFLRSAVYGS